MGLYSYTILEAPLPRISLYWNKNKKNIIKLSEENNKKEKEKGWNWLVWILTLPYLPVGSSSTKSE